MKVTKIIILVGMELTILTFYKKKCRSIVTFLKKSEIGHRCLQDKLKQLGFPDLKL